MDPFADFDVVLINSHNPDRALDYDAMRLDEYIRTRDPELIVEKTGMRAARFRVSRLPWRFAGFLRSLPVGHVRDCATFAAACHAITLASGAPVVPKLPEANADGIRQAPDAWLDDVVVKHGFGPFAIYEVAQVIREFSALTPDQQRFFSYPAG